MILSIVMLYQIVGSSLPAEAVTARSVPSQTEVEHELADNYRGQVLGILESIDGAKSFDALVKVSLAPGANLEGLADLENAPDEYLPGTLRVDNESRAKQRRRFEEQLVQSKDVLIIGPAETPAEVRASIGQWVTRELKLTAKETVKFQERPVLMKPESNRIYWLAAIAGLALVASIAVLAMLLMLNRRQPKKDEPKEAQTPPPAPKPFEPPPSEDKKAESKTDAAPTLASIEDVLNQIRRISLAHPEAASTALSHLVNKDELLPIVANVISALGMDSALELYPRVGPATWSRLGDALSEETSTGALSIEEFQIFVRALNGEMARAQRKVNEVKMLPTLEKQNSATISTRINGAGVQQGATMLALLSEPAITDVIPMIAKKDLAPMLTKMLSITSIAKDDITQFDRADDVGANAQNVTIESVAKVASALSALPSGEEMAMFDTLVERGGPKLLAEMATYRLYPPHIPYLPKEMLAAAIQGRELDELRKLTQSRPDLRDYVLRFVSDRQREALEDSAAELTDGSTVWRSLCDDLHVRLVKLGPAQINNLFSNRRVS